MIELDLPNLVTIELGDYSFSTSLTTVLDSISDEWSNDFIDLPKLKSVRLGYYSLYGVWGSSSCSLVMRGMQKWRDE